MHLLYRSVRMSSDFRDLAGCYKVLIRDWLANILALSDFVFAAVCRFQTDCSLAKHYFLVKGAAMVRIESGTQLSF
jgi:hypothetical protein